MSETPVDVDSMSIKAMKALIESVGMPHADCVEKSDLRARCREALARRAEAGRAPSPTAATGAPEEKLKDWQVKQREYEVKKARAKALKLRLTCTICGEKAKLNCPCGTTQYCSTECQRIDWRDRGHRKACKKIRDERAAEAARPEAPPQEVVYGPAPRSHADEVRARIAAEHEAARARREANPAPEPWSARIGSRCPICLEDWDMNTSRKFQVCCCRTICNSCSMKIQGPCALCGEVLPDSDAALVAKLRRHVEDEIPEAVTHLGMKYDIGDLGLVKSKKKAAKLYKRGAELGDVIAMLNLGNMYERGQGVKLDRKKALQLYRLPADRGHAVAQCNLANLLHRAGHVEEAVKYWRKAAEQDYGPACMSLGIEYANGNNLERDLDEAKRLISRAAATGLEIAAQFLAQINAQSQWDGTLNVTY